MIQCGKIYYNRPRTIEVIIDLIDYQKNTVVYSKFKLLTGTYLGQKSCNIDKFLKYYG